MFKINIFCLPLDTVRASISIKQSKIRVPSKCIEIGHNSRNCGIDSTWQNYIKSGFFSKLSRQICLIKLGVLVAAASSGENSSVSCGQVKSKDVPFSDT